MPSRMYLRVDTPTKAPFHIERIHEKGRLTVLNVTRESMNTRLYVRGFPYATTEDELRDAFAKTGSVVSATIIMDRRLNRSSGYGFVEMSTPEEAQAAIDMWNDKDFGGRTLTVNEARPREERGR